VLQARVIDIYQENGFGTLALQAKREYVERYGAASELRKTHAAAWERAQPLVRTHLAELARHHHASAQKSKSADDQQQAIRWYRELLTGFPADAQAAENNFLLAELLFESQRFAEAAAEYEKTAYDYPAHGKSADAGYAALLARAEQEKRAAEGERAALQLAGVDSALRFAEAFPADARAGAVLTNAAERLFALGQVDRAEAAAQQVLALNPPATEAQRRTVTLVLAHAAFDRSAFDVAERRYREVLALTAQERSRGEIVEKMAASIYKQGEQARSENRLRDAVDHFSRASVQAPTSTVAANAQFDAATALLSLKDWDAAARALEDFRRQQPKHPLQAEVGVKLALAYLELGRHEQAGAEFERIAATSSDAAMARDALWQAAELHEKAGASAAAVRSYERYIKQYPQPLTPAVEARYRLARLAKAQGNRARALALMKEVQQADAAAGGARTDRTRYLGATAALALAEPAHEAFSAVRLVEPLQKNLKLKKARLEEALQAYTRAAGYGVADAATAATYHTAELYGEFGRALLTSQRPKGLKKQELEQYDVLLEEQAFPFEEKALELHEVNARRAADGVYDDWVKRSYAALAKLRPVRFAKTEISTGVLDATR
jgi:TolA-binding protein